MCFVHGVSQEETEKYTKILKSNWFTTVELLLQVQREDWVAMNLPIRMYDVVKKALNDDIHRYLERNYGKISKTTKATSTKSIFL